MILEKYLIPDMMPDHFYDVTPEIVKNFGAKALICDIDNTLVTYDDPEPTEKVLEWIKEMMENGITVSFVSNNDWDRVKLFNGMLRACEKRPVSIDQLEKVVTDIETELQNSLDREVTSVHIGELVMDKLKALDEVAYVRFASVYRQFKDINTFMDELTKLLSKD